jgi:hypothetical protein
MLEEQMKAAGVEIDYTEPEDVAKATLDAIRDDRFWIHPASAASDNSVRTRTQSILDRSQPDTYLRAVPGQ